VQQVLKRAKQSLGEILSAVEFLDQESMNMATQYLPGVSNPLTQTGPDAAQQQQQQQQGGEGQGGPFYMVVETHGSNAAHDKKKLEGFLEVGLVAVVRLQLLPNEYVTGSLYWRDHPLT
jgi:D-2-hydroxyglutarate dehydrogenase